MVHHSCRKISFSYPSKFRGNGFGKPSYSFRYRLGGKTLLRGFRENRFRGNKFYSFQNELRYPLIKYLAVATFLDLGDVSDENLKAPQIGYGGGLRFGLPPTYDMKIRADLGKSKDQTNFVVAFGYAY